MYKIKNLVIEPFNEIKMYVEIDSKNHFNIAICSDGSYFTYNVVGNQELTAKAIRQIVMDNNLQ